MRIECARIGNGGSSSELVLPHRELVFEVYVARRRELIRLGGKRQKGCVECKRSRWRTLAVAPELVKEDRRWDSRSARDTRASECDRASNAAGESTIPLHDLHLSRLPMCEVAPKFDPVLMPKHVAIIMDGNTRWAKRRGWSSNRGHEAGVQTLQEIVRLSNSWGIKILTVYAFSLENWLRPKAEVEFLLHLFETVLNDESLNVFSDDICVQFIGNYSKLPPSLRRLISKVEERTREKKGLKLIIALSYSGRQDIIQACQALAGEVKAGLRRSEEIDEASISQKLLMCNVGEHIRDPDLLIRTSGEKRLSNFLLWQLAYTEFVFVDELWPDFNEAEYRKAILEYQKRDRRFGTHR